MAVELLDDACELDGFMFGGHVHGETVIMIEDVQFDTPDIVSVDRNLPRADGLRFGRDYRGGRTITFTMHVFGDTKTQAYAYLDRLAGVWLGDSVRSRPGAVQTLRIRSGGRTRVVYGRGRRFAPISTRMASTFWAPVVADFRCIDHYFYDDVEQTNTVGIIPESGGGLVAPLAAPLATVGVSYAPGDILVGGSVPTWPVFVVYGPIALPTVEVVDEYRVSLGITLRADQFVVIDPRPWSRGVRVQGIYNAAGQLTPASPRLSGVKLTPGRHEVILSGLDETGTSKLTVAWRDTYTSF